MEEKLAWMFFAIQAIYLIIGTITRYKLFYWLSLIPGILAAICFSLAFINAH